MAGLQIAIMTNTKALEGQSLLDICQEYYGNLDLAVKLANDSSILDLSEVGAGINYVYDENSNLINSNNTGYPYTTAYGGNVNFCFPPTGFEFIYTGATSIIFKFINKNANYQYFYNTTDSNPLDSDWINISTSINEILFLNPNTKYYFFIRTICNSYLFSPVVISNTTTLGRVYDPIYDQIYD